MTFQQQNFNYISSRSVNNYSELSKSCQNTLGMTSYYSNQRMAEMHFMCGLANGNAAATQRLYMEKYSRKIPRHTLPHTRIPCRTRERRATPDVMPLTVPGALPKSYEDCHHEGFNGQATHVAFPGNFTLLSTLSQRIGGAFERFSLCKKKRYILIESILLSVIFDSNVCKK